MMVDEQLRQPIWAQKKMKEKQHDDHDMQMFINYSFNRRFKMNEQEIEPFKAPKILGDVFEAIIGAIFIDRGIEECIQVLKPLLTPFVLYVAKYSKNIHKEPKEDFIQLSGQLKMMPKFKDTKEKVQVPMSTVLNRPLPPDQDFEETMTEVTIIYNNGEEMCKGYGNSKEQAEKNASIIGLQWLQQKKKDEIEELLKNSQFSLSLKACFMHYSNIEKYKQ